MDFNIQKIVSTIERYILKQNLERTGDQRRKSLKLDGDTRDVFLYANPVTIGVELLLKLCQLYPDYLEQIDSANNLEILCADELYKKLHSIKTDYEYVEIDEIDAECEGVDNDNGDDLFDDDGNLIENESNHPEFVPVTVKAEILEKISKHWGVRPFSWIQRHGGARLRHSYYKTRWEEQVKNGGTKFEKYKSIDSAVWAQFQEARQALHTVHGHDLKRWGMQAARVFPVTPSFKFTASNTWISAFKAKHKISSRKVNKIVKRSQIHAPVDYEMEMDKFRSEAKDLVDQLGAENVVNWDQSGCTYEVVSPRTLTHKGEPWTVCSARSPRNRATHSYTIQYTIAASGQVLDQIFICLQEINGRMGPLVEESIPPCPNIILTYSKSGKLTTSLIDYFLDQQMIPHVKKTANTTGFIIDHWGGQLNMSSYSSRFGVNETPQCQLLTVPKNCTPYCQPCDTVFYRQVKVFLRRMTEYAQLTDTDSTTEPFYSRKNVILMHSLIHYQLSAKIFQPMVIYAWYKAGILVDRLPYLNVKQACFTLEATQCEIGTCEREPFVRCARCRLHICFNCFYWDYHTPMNGCVDILETTSSDINSQNSCNSMEEE